VSRGTSPGRAAFPEPAVLIKTAAGAGRVRQVVHPFRLNARGAAGWLVAWLAVPVVVLLISLGVHAGAAPFLYLLVIAAAALAYPFAATSGMRIRVCERGLIVSTLPGGRSRFFIPYATIDPDSAMVHPVPRRGGDYRYQPAAAMTATYPWPAMSKFILATCPLRPRFLSGLPYGSPLNVWRAPYSRQAVSFRGLHPVFASPWWRARPAVRGHSARAQWVLGALRPLLEYPELVPVVMHHDQPVMRWMFGTDRPEELLGAIEQAMTAAGVRGAEGFTARARLYDRPQKEIPAVPRLW
jgi:hypothetical protein